jgi:zinc protease
VIVPKSTLPIPGLSAFPKPVVNSNGQTVPQEMVLPNGLRVVLLEDHAFPVVSCLVWYRAGSRNEAPGVTGLSHLVEHLLFQNIGNFRKNEFGANIVANGGLFNGFTSEDFTAFYSTVPSSRLDLVLHGEAERMRYAKFTRADVQSEINALLREFDDEGKDPQAVLNREVHAIAFQQHPYRNPPGGWRSDVEHLTYEDARMFYDRFFYPDNAALVLVGDFKGQTALALIKKHFLALPKSTSPIPPLRVVEQMPPAERRVTMKTASKKESLIVAYPAPRIGDADAPAMAVLEKLLNEQPSGRLRKQLIDQKICSSAQAVFEIKRDPSLFLLNLSAAGGTTLPKALEASDGMVNQLRSQNIPDAELSRAKKQAEFEFFNEADGPYHAGFHLGYFETLVTWQVAYDWPNKLRAVTNADIQRVSRRYLTSDIRVVGQLVSTSAQQPPVAKPAGAPTALQPGKPARSKTQDVEASYPIPPSTLLKVSKRFPHLRLAGYKDSDSAISSAVTPNTKKDTKSSSGKTSTATTTSKGSTNGEATKATNSNNTQVTGKGTNQPAMSASPTKPIAGKNPQAPANAAGQQTPAVRAPVVQTQSAPRATEPAKQIIPKSASSGAMTYRTLPNGMEVLVVESHLIPVVQVLGSVQAGSVFEAPDKKGLSALTAMVMNSSGSKAGRSQIVSEQEDIGLPPRAMIKFDSGLEEVRFQTRCLSKDLPAQLGRLASCLRDPHFQDADLDKAKADVLSSISQNEDRVSTKVERALLRSLIPATSPYYPADPSERAKSAATLSPSDVRDFHAVHVAPNVTCLVIAGDLEPARTFALVDRLFSSWSLKKDIARPPILLTDRRGSKSSLPLKDNAQSMVCLGRLISAKAENHEERTFSDLLIADCALTNHPIFSRLNQRLESEPELAGSFRSSALKANLEPLAEAIVWSLYLPLDAKSSSSSISAIQNELKHYGKTGLTNQELTEAKRYLLGAIPVNQMSNLEDLSKFHLDALVQRKEVDPFSEAAAEIRIATLESINSFIANGFKPDQAALVVAGNRQLIKQVHPARPDSTETQ